jgi:hypothetical protein
MAVLVASSISYQGLNVGCGVQVALETHLILIGVHSFCIKSFFPFLLIVLDMLTYPNIPV